MRLLTLNVEHLRILNDALDGRLFSALADAARSGSDLELRAIRNRPDPTQPSAWTLLVLAGGFERRFTFDTAVAGLGVVAHIYLSDIVDDLKADLAALVHNSLEAGTLDDHIAWPRRPGNGSLS